MRQHLSQSDKRRIVFTKDARLSVRRFDRAAKDGSGKVESIATLEGYPILWNTLSDDRGGYRVRLLPNSGTAEAHTMALFHHNFAAVIGNTQNGTLRITPDEVGVKVEIDLPDTTVGRDTEELVEQNYVKGMSFAISNAPKFTMVTEGGQKIMNITSFTYDEVTVTAIPSFTDTSVDILEDEEPEEDPAPETAPTEHAKKNENAKKDLVRDRLNIERYKLAELAEFQG